MRISLRMVLLQVEAMQVLLTVMTQMVAIITTIRIPGGVIGAMTQPILLNFARITIRGIFSNRGHSEYSDVKVTLEI